MLQCVIGTINSRGLTSLRLEDDTVFDAFRNSVRGCESVWAVLDSHDLFEIWQALLAMQPSTALRLLNERAVFLGRITA